MTRTISERQVLKRLKIDDFRHLSKDKVMAFMSMIPDMDAEVAKQCIAQFPNFKEMGTEMLHVLIEGYNHIMEFGSESQKQAMAAYETILDALKDMLSWDELTFDQKQQVADKMVEVADRIAEIDTRWKEFLANLAKIGGMVAIVGLALAASLLGVEIDTSKFNKIAS